MLINVGFGTLILTFLLSIYALVAAFIGTRSSASAWIDSARNAILIIFPMLSVTILCLIGLLVGNHFEVEYVASVISRTMPDYLKVTALWGGQAGSLIFWSWVMAAFTSAVALRDWKRDREFLPWVIIVTALTLAFFLSLSIVSENPFRRLWVIPSNDVISALIQPLGSRLYLPKDGNGLNPLLRHPGMIIHPPMLYLGFVAFIIPYAFGIAALVTGRTDDRWIRITRRWTLVAWLFLSLGLILGARWAYDVLGWGGYWGWDPVEISAFIPWLSGTAFLHSVIIQEKRGILKRWNMVLIILSYAFVIFGTFLTRSGVLSSVHAFSSSSIGLPFFIFIGVTFIASMGLVLYRWNDLKGERQMTSLLSREALFLLNNLIFMGILIVCLWGMIFPLISELVTGQKVTVGPPFYERATGPLFAALLLLMGIAPLSTWGHTTLKTFGSSVWKFGLASLVVVGVLVFSGMRSVPALLAFWLVSLTTIVIVFEFWWGINARHNLTGENIFVSFWHLMTLNRRRYGGYIIHIGVVLMALGLIGIELFQTETQATVPLNGKLVLGDYSIRYDSLSIFDTTDGRNVARAVVSVFKNDTLVAELHPRRDLYIDSNQPMTIPGVRSTWEDDIYVLLVDWLPITSEGASFKVFHNPLVSWLWVGALVFILGTLVAAWPDKEKTLQTKPKPRLETQSSEISGS